MLFSCCCADERVCVSESSFFRVSLPIGLSCL
jgi:hypothetical protein